jgi:hypothetical protein
VCIEKVGALLQSPRGEGKEGLVSQKNSFTLDWGCLPSINEALGLILSTAKKKKPIKKKSLISKELWQHSLDVGCWVTERWQSVLSAHLLMASCPPVKI